MPEEEAETHDLDAPRFLSLERAHNPGNSRSSSARPGSQAKRIRVVIADQYLIARVGIRQVLEAAPDVEVVAEAEDGEQAIAAIRATAPDVAVLGVRMQKASGIAVTRWVRENAVSTTVLLLSVYDSVPYVLAALRAGANGFFLKNARLEDIVRAVHSVHDGKTALDPHIARRLLGTGSPVEATCQEELTAREREVLALVAKGYTNKAIGAELQISARTVQTHLAHVFRKLQADGRTTAVMRAAFLGLLPGPRVRGADN